MNFPKIFKAIFPHLLAVLVFLIVNLFLYFPIFLENKSINQNDILQGAGANQELIEFRQQTGEEGLWTNSMFRGMPAYLINVYWSGDLLHYLQKVLSFGLPSPVTHSFMAMVCFYILLLVFNINPFLAIAGGLVYGANPYFIILIEAGHIWKVSALSFMPLVLAAIELAFRKKHLSAFALMAVAMSLEIRANHLQMTYYLLLVVLIYGIFKLVEAIRNKTLVDFSKSIIILAVAVVLAVGANLGRLWSAYEYGKFSIRGPAELSQAKAVSSGGLDRSYAFQWSNGIWEPLTLAIPYFYGGGSVESLGMNSKLAKGLLERGVPAQQAKSFVDRVPTYWGDQPFTSGPAYIGAIMVFLFITGLFIIQGGIKWWLLAATVFTIMLSWGHNFEALNYLMFDYFPGYNKFRAVASIIVMPLLTIPLLAMLTFQKLVDEGLKAHRKHLIISFGISAGFCALLLLLSGAMSFSAAVDEQFAENAWLVDLIRQQRAALLVGDAFRSLILISISVLMLYLYHAKKIGLGLMASLFVAIVAIDMLAVDKRYLKEDNFVKNLEKNYFAQTEADKRILQDNALHYRVLNLQNPFNEAKTSYHHSSIGGYHGAKMRRYQDLIDQHIQEEISMAVQNLQSGRGGFSDLHVLNMLNTKYLKFGDNAGQVIANPSANGNGWFVTDIKKANTPDEEIVILGDINTSMTAVIDANKFSVPTRELGNGTVTLKEYKPNYLKYEVKSITGGLALFSEIYYPMGWKAYIDGKETDILRANYVLRALEIPENAKLIEFRFEPAAYTVGNKVMLACSLLVMMVMVGALFMEVKNGLPK